MEKTEKQTRKEIIDKKLFSAGWDVENRAQVIEEFDINDRSEFSDYVLLGKDGKPLAIVEAKKTSKDAELGREQAKQYCYNIQAEYKCKLPFCFYTNGHNIFLWDLENYPPRKVIGFPTRDDLERYQYLRKNRKPIDTEFINTSIAGRNYQLQAIRSVTEAIEKKQRKFLLVMATGTGKTRTCIALTDTLMRTNWCEKVLFLVDRIALQEQALEAFKEHLPDEPRWPKLGEKQISKDRRIYVSTYPTMLNIIRNGTNTLSPHFFDLVVVDESHRSIYNTYQEILDYFNAIILGLTATPTGIIDHNTFKLFNCEDEIPTFAYSYDEAVNHIPPYLSNFQVMKIHTKFQDEGISKRTISLEDQKKMILQGKEVAEINFEGTDLEKKVINKGTNSLIVKEFMEECIKDPNGVLPGKTIFFCASIPHARRIEKIFDALYPEYKGELAKVIVSDDQRVYGKGGLLDQFKTSDFPRIAISVGMLDTGIDILELVNLVFVKPVYSYTRFWQMIGRGTRLLNEEKIKPWCPEKDVFLILDCWDNFEYFKLNPKGKDIKQQIPLPVKFAGLRIDKIEKAIDNFKEDISQKEITKLKDQISELPKESVNIKNAEHFLDEVNDDNFWENLDHQKLEFLRNEIKPLFKTVSQQDFKRMRFQKDVLETSLSLLSNEKEKFETLKANLVEKISELPLSVNVVAKEKELIEKVQTNRFWTKITDEELDELSAVLAPLMKYRDPSNGTEITKLNLKDLLKTKEFIEFGPEHEAISILKYREMVEQKILELTEENPILQKIQNNDVISPEEAEKLANDLFNLHPHITEELLQKVYKNQKAKFIQFIRHILGIEILKSFPETVSELVDDFIKEHSYMNTRQLEFLHILRDFVIERGNLTKKDLIQAPFTVIHPKGIRGIFNKNEINEILEIMKKLVA
ncbi:MAG: DEAD/DEAH box helicase family protein [Candidatus Tenebribacter mawsonii]|nr:DEAD/DEAH box helicase family protein [Candidatus Tenebribacter mawsonii]